MHGKHIKVVGKGDVAKMGNVGNVKAFLSSLVTALGMRSLKEVALDVPIELDKLKATPFEDEGGITGVAVLSTSHCSIHTWPARNHYVMDVYSCRDFRSELVVTELVKFFGEGAMHVSDLTASLRTPEELLDSGTAPGTSVALDPTNLARWMGDRSDYAEELADMSDAALAPEARKRRRDARTEKRAAKAGRA